MSAMVAYWRIAAVVCFRPCGLTIALLKACRGIGSEVLAHLVRDATAQQQATIAALMAMRSANGSGK